MAEGTGFIEPSPQLKAHELALAEVADLLEEAANWSVEEQAYLLTALARYAAERAGDLLHQRTVGTDPAHALLWLNAQELAGVVQQSAGVLADLIEHIRNLEK